MLRPILACCVVLLACDDKPTQAKAEASLVMASDLQLEAVTELVAESKVKDGRELEEKLNDPDDDLVKIDIDKDGERDFVEVVEVKQSEIVLLELRAIPSSKHKDENAAVLVATLEFKPEPEEKRLVVTGKYSTVVAEHEAKVFVETEPVEFRGEVAVFASGTFLHWVFLGNRELYRARYYREVDCWPPGHCKHGKWKAKERRETVRVESAPVVKVDIDVHGGGSHSGGGHGGKGKAGKKGK